MILHPASRARRLGPFGLPGSDRLGRALGPRLDDGWHWFRSVAPGGIEPIDGVLVGPGGTFALTIQPRTHQAWPALTAATTASKIRM